MSTNVMDRLSSIEKALSDLAKRPASRATPVGVFNGDSPFTPHKSNEWPMEKLKKLGEFYGDGAAHTAFLRKSNGGMRLSGLGPALLRLAGMSGNADAVNMAKMHGMTGNYGEEQFAREFGFVSVSKAQTQGIPMSNGQVRKVALAEGSGQTGGYIVPPQFMNELLSIAAEDAFIEPRARVVPMTTRTMQFPMLDVTTNQGTGVSPYFGGITATWQPEAATISETEPAFKQTEWTAYDLVLYTVSSNQLLMDNGVGLDALLTQLFGQATTWFKEYAYLQGLGAGASMPLGVINAPATYQQSRATSNRFTLADAAAMMSRLQVKSWDSACWIMHQSVLPQLIQMASGATIGTASTTNIPGNMLTWLNPMGNNQGGPAQMKFPQAFLNGLPLYITEKLPTLGSTGDVMLVDWSMYVIGQRMEMQIDVSPHYLFRNNQLAWRVVCRGDGKPWLNSSITDAAGFTVSPFVVLAA